MEIISPIATGNGAYVVHKIIERQLHDYHVFPYHPNLTLFPPALYSLGRSEQVRLIHTTPDYALFHTRKHTPLVITFHNYVLDVFMRNYSSHLQTLHYKTDLRWFTHLAVRKAIAITAVSNFTANLVKQDMRMESKIRVIYNGIDETVFQPKRSNTSKTSNIIILFSGNLSTRKGAQWLLPIAQRLHPNITIQYTSGLRSNNKLPDHLQLQCIGQIPHSDMPALYQQADILLFPTVREGFGLAATEAMACGLPVVATNCSSLPELIDEGKGGFLCPLGDVNAFAEKINLLAENSQLRREMGEYNRTKVEQCFTLDRMVSEYRELFYSLL